MPRKWKHPNDRDAKDAARIAKKMQSLYVRARQIHDAEAMNMTASEKNRLESVLGWLMPYQPES